jgi:hypothetical protein
MPSKKLSQTQMSGGSQKAIRLPTNSHVGHATDNNNVYGFCAFFGPSDSKKAVRMAAAAMAAEGKPTE